MNEGRDKVGDSFGSLKDEFWKTPGEAWAFARGAAVMAILTLLFVGFVMHNQRGLTQQDKDEIFKLISKRIDTDLARATCLGRAQALNSVVEIISHDGSYDEIIDFAQAMVRSGFEDLSPTNFYGRNDHGQK